DDLVTGVQTCALPILLYIAMRYVSGTDMRQMIKKRGRILPATALFLIGQATRALDAAHRKGLVHRDVKPGNLLIERGSDDADPEIGRASCRERGKTVW